MREHHNKIADDIRRIAGDLEDIADMAAIS